MTSQVTIVLGVLGSSLWGHAKFYQVYPYLPRSKCPSNKIFKFHSGGRIERIQIPSSGRLEPQVIGGAVLLGK